MEAGPHACPACQTHAEDKNARSSSEQQPLALVLSVAFLFFLLSLLAGCATILGLCFAAAVIVGTWSFCWQARQEDKLKPDDQELREAKSKARELEIRLEELQKGNAGLQEELAKLTSFMTALHPGQGISDLFVSILDDLLEGYLPEAEELHMARQMVQHASLVSSQNAGLPKEHGDLEPYLRALLLDLSPTPAEIPPQSLHEITPGLLPFTYQFDGCTGTPNNRKDEGQQLQPEPLTGMLASLVSENSSLDAQCYGFNPDVRYALLGRIMQRRESGGHASSSKWERGIHSHDGLASEELDADTLSQRGVHCARVHSSGANAQSWAGSWCMHPDSGACAIDSGSHASAGLAPFYRSRKSRSVGGLQALGLQYFVSAPTLVDEGKRGKVDAGAAEGTALDLSASHSMECMPRECMPRDLVSQPKQPRRLHQSQSMYHKRSAIEDPRDLECQLSWSQDNCPPRANSLPDSEGKAQGRDWQVEGGGPAAAQQPQHAAALEEASYRHPEEGLHLDQARTFVKHVLNAPSLFSENNPSSSSRRPSSGVLKRSKSSTQHSAQDNLHAKKSVRGFSSSRQPEDASAEQNTQVAHRVFAAAGSEEGTLTLAGVRASAAGSGTSAAGERALLSPAAPSDPDNVQATAAQQQPGSSAAGDMSPVHASRRDSAASRGGPWQDAATPSAPSHALVLEVEAVLREVYNSWNCDSFRLCEVTQGHPLSTLGYFIVVRTGLMSSLGIQPVKLARFLRRIEAGYRAPEEVPYHNRVHAADVLQTLHVIMHHGGLLSALCNDPLMSLAAYLSAILHDYKHEGYTNDFIINSTSELAVTYNDKAPLENYHLAAGFRVLLDPDCDFLALPKPEFAQLRKAVIELVLATDMKQHFAHLGLFSALLQKTKSSFRHLSGGGQGKGSNPCEAIRSVLDTSPKKQMPLRHCSAPGVPNYYLHGTSEGALILGSGQARSFSGPLPAQDRASQQTLFSKLSVDRLAPRASKELPSKLSMDRLLSSHLSVGSRPHAVQEADVPVWHGLDLAALDASQRLLLLQIVLKCADIGHLAEDQGVHVK